jgi:hypothetical protein
VSVDVVDAAGEAVRRLATSATVAPADPLRLSWDGRTDDGDLVPDGRYRVRVTLRTQGRSVTVPRTTLVDTRAPRPRVKSIDPGPIVAPGTAPIQIEVGSVSRRLAKRARVYRIDGESPSVVAELAPVTDTRTLQWDGKVDGKPAPVGLYLVQVTARDRAGNDGTTPKDVPPERGESRGVPGFTIRAIAAQPPARPVTAGRKVTINVDARGRPYRWALRRIGKGRPVRKGRGKGHELRITAPDGDSGLYTLQLAVPGHSTKVPILVQSRERARMLVVVPMMTWIGSESLDEDHDGVLNTLATGEPVSWPRVQPDGLPQDVLETAGPLLAFLDAAGVRYDITSDLDLALSESPRASDRAGVLLAGSERWIPRSYARRLRDYVDEGGRVASIGVESLRRGVAVRATADRSAGRLLRPTQPTVADPFGARFEPVRDSGALVTLSLIDGDPGYGLLEGFDGTLEGFSAREESEPAEGGRVLAALGVENVPSSDEDTLTPPRPSVTATELGKGVIIRVGLPNWAQRLDDRQVAQITLNIADLLRHLPAKIHTPPKTG